MPELEPIEDEDILASDDLMPNEGGSQVFQPLEEDPEEAKRQKIAENAEKVMILGAEPLLDEIFKWLDFSIEDCDSIKHLDTKSNVSLESQLVGMKLAKEKLVTARAKLNSLKEAYIQKQN